MSDDRACQARGCDNESEPDETLCEYHRGLVEESYPKYEFWLEQAAEESEIGGMRDPGDLEAQVLNE